MYLYLQGLCIPSWTEEVLKMEAIRQTWIYSNDPENRSREPLRVTANVYQLTKHSFPQNKNANQEYCQNFKHFVTIHVRRRVPTQDTTSTERNAHTYPYLE